MTNADLKEIKVTLKKLKEESGLSASELSAKTGIPTNTIYGLFNSNRPIKEEDLVKFAKAFGVKPADIDPSYQGIELLPADYDSALFINNLKAFKEQHNLIWRDIAGQINVPLRTVQSWRDRVAKPNSKQVDRLAKMLNIPVSRLLSSKIIDDKKSEREKRQELLREQQIFARYQVARNLNGWLAKRDKNGAQLAEYVGTSPSAVNNWRSGRSFITDKNVRKIAEFLKCQPTDIDPSYLYITDKNKGGYATNFSKNLQKLRIETGKTQIELANDLGVSISTFRRWSTGDIPDKGNLQRLANFFDVSVQYLLSNNSLSSKDIGLTPSQQRVLSHIDASLSGKDVDRIIDYIEALKTVQRAMDDSKKDSFD